MKSPVTQPNQLKISDFEDKSLLIVDDDDPFRDRLSRALEKKGFPPKGANSVEIAQQLLKTFSPKFAVVDLRLEGGNGLDIVKEIKNLKKERKNQKNEKKDTIGVIACGPEKLIDEVRSICDDESFHFHEEIFYW